MNVTLCDLDSWVTWDGRDQDALRAAAGDWLEGFDGDVALIRREDGSIQRTGPGRTVSRWRDRGGNLRPVSSAPPRQRGRR